MARNSIISGASLPSTPDVGDLFVQSGGALNYCSTDDEWTAVGTGSGGGIFDITDYGASTGASATANVTAINAAADAAVTAGGGTVFFPPGIFNINGTIHIHNGIHYLGCGADLDAIWGFTVGTTLKMANGNNCAHFALQATGNVTFWSIKSMSLVGEYSGATKHDTGDIGIYINSSGVPADGHLCHNYAIEEVVICDRYYGIKDIWGFLGSYKRVLVTGCSIGFWKQNCTCMSFENCFIRGNAGERSGYDVQGWHFEHTDSGNPAVTLTACAGDGWATSEANVHYFANMGAFTINGFDCEECYTPGTTSGAVEAIMQFSACPGVTLNGLKFLNMRLQCKNEAGSAAAVIALTGGTNATVSGLHCTGSSYLAVGGQGTSSAMGIYVGGTDRLLMTGSYLPNPGVGSGYTGGRYGINNSGAAWSLASYKGDDAGTVYTPIS